MYNSQIPQKSELPTTGQLLKSTAIAFVSAAAIMVAVVLPAEFGVDPTGAGRLIGLTEMGEIKTQLSEEAEADRNKADRNRATLKRELRSDAGQSFIGRVFAELFIGSAAAHGGQDSYDANAHEMSITLAPGEGMELKLDMHEGDRIDYSWSAGGAALNFDLHGENESQSVSYKKSRGADSDQGSFTAAFDGEHGWWWRNRTDADVTVTLRTEGVYGEVYEYR